jgi:hypothetical protein
VKQVICEVVVEHMHKAFTKSPHNSLRRAGQEVQLSCSSVHDAVHKHQCSHTFQHIMCNDQHLRAEFATESFACINEDNSNLDTVCFYDNITFHLCDKANKHSCTDLVYKSISNT